MMRNLSFSQRGISLIEIMIALALATIIILAMLRAFVTTGKVTAESSMGARTDSSLMLGLISVDRIIQGIGFGSTATAVYGSDIGVFAEDGVLIAKGTNGSILIWKNTTTTCKAFVNESTGLNLYGGSFGYSCTGLEKPSNSVSKELLIPVNSTPIKNNTNKIGEFEFKIQDVTNCIPFGISNPAISSLTGKYQVELTAYSYAASSNSTARVIRNITCLMNLK